MKNQRGIANILALGLILALAVFVLGSVILYQKNVDLQKELAGQMDQETRVVQRPPLNKPTSGSDYIGEPVDWEGGNQVNYYSCENDNECIKVDTDTCTCHTSGGTKTAINIKYKDRWQTRIKSAFTICSLDSLPPERRHQSCKDSTIPLCINSECQIVKK
jgi:hypothetical protein